MQTVDSSRGMSLPSAEFFHEETVNTDLRLGDFATTPLYNIKAVVQATNISPSTLRAWERRYHMCRPQRSESGYRLYSERDVAIIRWLKTQVDAGMAISQAVAWLESIVAEAENQDDAVLPGAAAGAASADRAGVQGVPSQPQVRHFVALQEDLLAALLVLDEHKAEMVLSEAFSMYTFEEIGEKLIQPVLVEIGVRWRDGDLSVAAEHFASNYLRQRLDTLLHTLPNPLGGDPIWVGCAPGEQHEIGALLLSIYLRRAGYAVHYFGQSLDIDGMVSEVKRHQPAMVLLSASTQTSALELAALTEALTAITPRRPVVGYGGQAFIRRPELRDEAPGIFMGASAQEALEVIDELLANDASARRR